MYPDEQLDDLERDGLKILQKKEGFKYGLDAVLLAWFVELKSHTKLLDIGTGSGIIPLLLTARRAEVDITALDIQPEYVEMARRSVALNHLENIEILQLDAMQLDQHFGPGSFSLVVTNPPYYKHRIASPHVSKAIARSEIKLTLEGLIRNAAFVLKPRGELYMIYHPSRLSELFKVFRMYQLEPKKVCMIHPARDKEANLVLIKAIKQGGEELRVLPPLIVYEEGKYTREILAIYDEVKIERDRSDA